MARDLDKERDPLVGLERGTVEADGLVDHPVPIGDADGADLIQDRAPSAPLAMGDLAGRNDGLHLLLQGEAKVGVLVPEFKEWGINLRK